MTQENAIIPVENIRPRIHTVRSKQVMLDSDLAEIYRVETKVFNQAVKRNIERFPGVFRFQLSHPEYDQLLSACDRSGLRSQIVTLKKGGRGQHRKYLPYVFTEQGVSMLSAVLRSDTAIKVSIHHLDIYHIGASLKDLGKKWFAFSKFESGALDMLQKLGGTK